MSKIMIEENPKKETKEAKEEKEKETEAEIETEAEAEPKAKELKKTKPEEKKEEKPEKPAGAPKEEKKEIKVPKNLKKLVEEIEELKVADLAILVKVLENKFGVSAIAPMITPAAPASAEAAAGKEEKKFFNVALTAVGDKKIEVIKAVRDATQRGLRDSKDLVDKAAEGPQILKENVKKEEAEEMKKKLETAGATVELK